MRTRRVVFMGWADELPQKSERYAPATEYDLLRAVMLADDAPAGRWVIFRCESADHAFKFRRALMDANFGNDYEIVMRYDHIYIRRRS